MNYYITKKIIINSFLIIYTVWLYVWYVFIQKSPDVDIFGGFLLSFELSAQS